MKIKDLTLGLITVTEHGCQFSGEKREFPSMENVGSMNGHRTVYRCGSWGIGMIICLLDVADEIFVLCPGDLCVHW